MKSVLLYPAKRCVTAAGMLIYQEKVLLIKHKKLGIWFSPGGHSEGVELLHQTAEREFWEETGIKAHAVDPHFQYDGTSTAYVPSPIVTNVHWVCQENYHRRLKNPNSYTPVALWPKGCEQHIGFVYLLQPDDVRALTPTKNKQEVLDIGWFSLEQLGQLEMPEDIQQEIRYGFTLMRDLG